MVLCAIYVLFALGLNIVVGYAGLLDLGYVAFFLFGAYTPAWLMSDFFLQINPASTSSGRARLTRRDPGIHLTSGSCSIAAAGRGARGRHHRRARRCA